MIQDHSDLTSVSVVDEHQWIDADCMALAMAVKAGAGGDHGRALLRRLATMARHDLAELAAGREDNEHLPVAEQLLSEADWSG